jgi:hypothetical protein
MELQVLLRALEPEMMFELARKHRLALPYDFDA